MGQIYTIYLLAAHGFNIFQFYSSNLENTEYNYNYKNNNVECLTLSASTII